jgi:hypothetical protein
VPEAFTPHGFAEQILGLKLYKWQADVLADLMPVRSKVVLRAANESGKTSTLVAPAVAWHLAMFPGSQVVLTSGVWRQVTEQMWRHIGEYSKQFGWKITKSQGLCTAETPQGSRALGFSTDIGNRFEGFHADDHVKKPLLIVIDEAKEVKDEIYEAVIRCNPTRLLVLSSPGGPNGFFYDLFRPRSNFKQYKVTAHECPHLGPEHIQSVIDSGKPPSSLLYKSMIEAEWMADPNELFVCNRLAAERCLWNPPDKIRGRLIAAIDVARSDTGDENVIALRDGNHLMLDTCFVGENDSVRIVDRLIGRLNALRLAPGDVWLDCDGIGAAYLDIFRAKAWHINEWRGSMQARDNRSYVNMAAEAWYSLGRAIEDKKVIIPPDPVWMDQLCSRHYFVTEKGKIKLESKEDMPKSPDRADAMAMVHSISAIQSYNYGSYVHDAINPYLNSEDYGAFDEMDREIQHARLPHGFNVGY